MFKKNKKTKKIILFLIIIFQVFTLSVSSALAAYPVTMPLPTPTDVLNEIEGDLHLNNGSLQNLGETVNTASTKGVTPEVSLIFDPTNPIPGEKITAQANPSFFSNPNSDLYYTWYLKHKSGNKDWNKDGRVDIEDYKIEAARIIAEGDFDPSSVDYNTAKNSGGHGYQASFGGDNQYQDTDAHCYIHDFQSGIDSEMNGCDHLFPMTKPALDADVGDGSFGLDEEKFWGVNPSEPDTAKTGNPDEANIAGLGIDKFSWNYQPGDEVGVAVEGVSTSPTKYSDSSNMIMWALLKNDCTHKEESEEAQCPNGQEPICIGATSSYTYNYSNPAASATSSATCAEESETPDCSTQSPVCPNGTPVCMSQGSIPTDGVFVPNPPLTAPITGYDDGGNPIYGPLPPQSCSDYITANNIQQPTCSLNTNNSQSSVQTGTKAAFIDGYAVSIPTTDIQVNCDPSHPYCINKCLEDNFVDPMGQSSKLDVSLTYTPDSPNNDSTAENSGDVVSVQSVIDNSTQSPQQQLYNWSVGISPDGTVSPDGGFKDITKELIAADLISGPVQGNGIPALNFQLNLNPTTLGGISQQTFDNYFPGGVGYIKVTAAVNENFSSGVTSYGKGDAIIKVTSSDKKIVAYNVGINSDGTLNIDDNASNIICPGNSVCYVTKDQIIGVKVDGNGLDNFYWTLNNNPLNCNSSVSSQCSSTAATNYNFFPVTGNIGDTLTLNLTANDVQNSKNGNTGENLQLVKNFQIVEPYLSIGSGDQNSVWPKTVGTYTDLNGNASDDISDSVFQTYPGNQMKLDAVFHPASIENSTPISWKIDGYDFSNADNVKEITLAADKSVGDTYEISLSGLYTQPAEVKKALQNIWGISEFDSGDENLSADIQIEVVANPGVSKIDSPKKFFAAIVGAVPENFVFLLRIMITIGVLIFVCRMIFSLNPKSYYEA